MEPTLKPIGIVRDAPARTYPIFSFDGQFIRPRKTPLKTLGDLLDYGYSVEITCGCRRSVTVMPSAKFLRLKNPPPETTLVRDLPDWLMCSKCAQKSDISVMPTEGCNAGIVPRKSGTMKQGYFVPYVPFEVWAAKTAKKE